MSPNVHANQCKEVGSRPPGLICGTPRGPRVRTCHFCKFCIFLLYCACFVHILRFFRDSSAPFYSILKNYPIFSGHFLDHFLDHSGLIWADIGCCRPFLATTLEEAVENVATKENAGETLEKGEAPKRVKHLKGMWQLKGKTSLLLKMPLIQNLLRRTRQLKKMRQLMRKFGYLWRLKRLQGACRSHNGHQLAKKTPKLAQSHGRWPIKHGL